MEVEEIGDVIEKEFVPFDIALAMRELGFDELCYADWGEHDYFNGDLGRRLSAYNLREPKRNSDWHHTVVTPFYQQAFRWFREEYNIKPEIKSRCIFEERDYYFLIEIKNEYTHYSTYEEAQDACLRKLIEIVKKTNKDEK